MLITKQIEIDMGHRVPNHQTKCRNLHGHRYKIEVGVDDKVIDKTGASDEGMVIDFSDLKEVMMTEIDGHMDHNSMFFENDPIIEHLKKIEEFQNKEIILVPFIPTAENIAKYIYERIQNPLKERGVKLKYVKIWETPTSTATYQLD